MRGRRHHSRSRHRLRFHSRGGRRHLHFTAAGGVAAVTATVGGCGSIFAVGAGYPIDTLRLPKQRHAISWHTILHVPASLVVRPYLSVELFAAAAAPAGEPVAAGCGGRRAVTTGTAAAGADCKDGATTARRCCGNGDTARHRGKGGAPPPTTAVMKGEPMPASEAVPTPPQRFFPQEAPVSAVATSG